MNRNSNWTTWYGSKINLSEMSHQHLSNILHYFKLLLGLDVPEIRQELGVRFGGIQLPYHPMISFRQEINALVSKGYTTGENNADIIVDGKWIGKIIYN